MAGLHASFRNSWNPLQGLELLSSRPLGKKGERETIQSILFTRSHQCLDEILFRDDRAFETELLLPYDPEIFHLHGHIVFKLFLL